MRPPATAPRATSHVVCVVVAVGIAVAFTAGILYFYLQRLRWEARYLEATAKPPEAPERVDKVYLRGMELLEEADRYAWVLRDYENAKETARRAEESFAHVVAAYPDRPRGYLGTARCRAMLFDYAAAVQQYEEALSREEDVRARFDAGFACFGWELVRRCALTREEWREDAVAKERRTKAEAHFTEFINAASETPRQYVAAAAVAAIRADYDEVGAFLDNADTLDLSLPHTALVRGWVRLLAGDPTAASQHMIDMLGRYAYMPEAHAVRARAFVDLGQPRGARNEWTELLKLWPACAEAHLALGRLLRELGEPGADEHFRNAVELDPSLKTYLPE